MVKGLRPHGPHQAGLQVGQAAGGVYQFPLRPDGYSVDGEIPVAQVGLQVGAAQAGKVQFHPPALPPDDDPPGIPFFVQGVEGPAQPVRDGGPAPASRSAAKSQSWTGRPRSRSRTQPPTGQTPDAPFPRDLADDVPGP